jgi:hypothetical protein
MTIRRPARHRPFERTNDAMRDDIEQDDEEWFEALAGRARPGTQTATLIEATLLREATRRWHAPVEVDAALLQPQALIERARAEGLGRRHGWCGGCAERWRWLLDRFGSGRGLSGWPVAGAAAAVLGLAVVLINIDRDTAPGPEAGGQPVLRSPADAGRYLLHDAQARERRNRIADELASAGVPVQRYERLGRFGLDAQIAMPPAAAVAGVLALNGVEPAADGALMVEVDAEVGARP